MDSELLNDSWVSAWSFLSLARLWYLFLGFKAGVLLLRELGALLKSSNLSARTAALQSSNEGLFPRNTEVRPEYWEILRFFFYSAASAWCVAMIFSMNESRFNVSGKERKLLRTHNPNHHRHQSHNHQTLKPFFCCKVISPPTIFLPTAQKRQKNIAMWGAPHTLESQLPFTFILLAAHYRSSSGTYPQEENEGYMCKAKGQVAP